MQGHTRIFVFTCFFVCTVCFYIIIDCSESTSHTTLLIVDCCTNFYAFYENNCGARAVHGLLSYLPSLLDEKMVNMVTCRNLFFHTRWDVHKAQTNWGGGGGAVVVY